MSTTLSTDIFFVLLALLAAGCFAALIVLQVLEWQYYKDPAAPFGNVWPEVLGK